MTKTDEAELHRLCSELEQVDRLPLTPPQREALKKAGIALFVAFGRGHRGEVERCYQTLGQQLSEDQIKKLESLGIESGSSESV